MLKISYKKFGKCILFILIFFVFGRFGDIYRRLEDFLFCIWEIFECWIILDSWYIDVVYI